MKLTVSGILIDPVQERSFGATVIVAESGLIADIVPCPAPPPVYIIPGLVDAHVHIESSMLTPTAFARAAVRHGTLGAVADPHEIANVLGRAGVERMLESAARTPFVFGMGVPACVPATPFETAGAELDAAAVADLLRHPGVTHLAEMMNVPGVLQRDPGIWAKIEAARLAGKPIDGHAPGLTGPPLEAYAAAGISTDHESLTLDEAIEKAALGLFVQIRYGSAAPHFEPFLPLLDRHPERCMFCSDDKHPDDLIRDHINTIAAAAYRRGISIHAILRAASVNPVRHYRLPLGLLQIGDPADFIVLDDFTTFRPQRAYLHGRCIFDEGRIDLPDADFPAANRFTLEAMPPDAFRVVARDGDRMHVMQTIDGSLQTGHVVVSARVEAGLARTDTGTDLLKLAVCNRYHAAPPAIAFIQGFGLRSGALASSVAHDSHNLIAVGATDTAMAAAVNAVSANRGGLAVADDAGNVLAALPLPIAGLMSPDDAETVAARYAACDRQAKALGSTLHAPFMTLAFMALPVIPRLKLTDKGLFDASLFAYTPLLIH